MKKSDEEIYQIIKEIIDEWDPVWLLEAGAPKDEYDFETRKIANSVMEFKAVDELSKYIYDLFLKMFEESTKTKAKEHHECDQIAKKIFQKLN